MKIKPLRWPSAVRVILLIVLLSLFFAFTAYAQVKAQDEQESLPSAGTTYTVQFGDTLAGIAFSAYGVGEYYEPLCAYNELPDCHVLGVGTQIVIPLLEDLGELPSVNEASSTEETQVDPPVETGPTPTPTPTPTPQSTVTEPEATPTPQVPLDPDPALTAVPEEMRASLRTIVEGDELGAIAREVYNNATLAGRLCAYNQLTDCLVLEAGIRIFTPVLDELLFGESHMFLPPIPTAAPSLSTETGVGIGIESSEDPTPTPLASSPGQSTDPSPTPAPAPPEEPISTPSIPPPSLGSVDAELTLNQFIDLDSRLEICAYLLGQTSVPQVLNFNGPYTLFLPSDSAWVAADTALIQRLLTNESTLDSTLRAYVVPGEFTYQDLSRLASVTSLDGRIWAISEASDGTVLVGNARISQSTSEPIDGVIHFLNLVQP